MKIPKTIKMFGYTWKIKMTKEAGGDFIWKTKTIQIGTKFKEQEAIFLHEIMEAILMELQFRFYGQETNMEYQFHFDHTGFVRFHKAFYQVLKDNKLI
jgi:hypothetical protein